MASPDAAQTYKF